MADHFVGAVKEMHKKLENIQVQAPLSPPSPREQQEKITDAAFYLIRNYPRLLVPKTGK